jgi:hypothetical protein
MNKKSYVSFSTFLISMVWSSATKAEMVDDLGDGSAGGCRLGDIEDEDRIACMDDLGAGWPQVGLHDWPACDKRHSREGAAAR